MKTRSPKSHKGFTLLETLISIAIFTVVATVAIGALIVVQSASRRASMTRVLVDNLGYTVDDIVRTAQDNATFQVQAFTSANPPYHQLTVKDEAGTTVAVYRIYYDTGVAGGTQGFIEKSKDGVTNLLNITQREVDILSPSRFEKQGKNPSYNNQCPNCHINKIQGCD
jgi:prepilin-type N-terminal cleavage/methylation domain-containing protein